MECNEKHEKKEQKKKKRSIQHFKTHTKYNAIVVYGKQNSKINKNRKQTKILTTTAAATKTSTTTN